MPFKDAAAQRAWKARNRERVAAYDARRDKERRRAQWRVTASKRREHRAAVKAAWHERNRDVILAKKKTWRDARPGWNVAADAKRRAVKVAATTGPVDLGAILQKANGLCGICGEPLGDEKAHFDHVIPLSRGGTHTQDNLQAAHKRCNLRKHAKVA